MSVDSSRNNAIDLWRGFALATITINHVPGNPVEPFTHKNFGFSDSAELFVLLAGMAVSLAYLREPGQTVSMRAILKIGARIRTIYMAHITVLVIAAAMVCFAVQETEDIRILEATQFDLLVSTPLSALVGVVTLGLQPAYFNILPLYIVLMGMAPLFMIIAARSRAAALAVSAVVYGLTELFGLHIRSYPAEDSWFFNPFAWQFLFVIGLCLGGSPPPSRFGRVLLPASALVLLLGLVVVRGDLYPHVDLSPLPRFLWDTDKTNLSLPRLLHVLALAYVVGRLRIGAAVAASPWVSPLVAMGRYSLPVFCVGGLLSLAIQLVRPALDASAGVEIALVVGSLIAQAVLAMMLEWNRGRSVIPFASQVQVT